MMRSRWNRWILVGAALSLASPAWAEETIIEERYKVESYRSGAAAMPTASPAPRVIEKHESQTVIEQRVQPPPPPPPVVEKQIIEERIETD